MELLGGRHRLFTWSWRAALAADPPGVTLVRISLGRPKWVPASRTATIPYIEELAPAGGLFHLEGDEFVAAYRDRLDSIGVDWIDARFRDVAAAHGGLPLVLLRFERSPADCHRGDFADWWLERSGRGRGGVPAVPLIAKLERYAGLATAPPSPSHWNP